MIHPNCEHMCSSNCRREGCNCECGEWHDGLTKEELDEILEEEEPKVVEEIKKILNK